MRTPGPPYTQPPDPFRANGPDGGHYRPGRPADFRDSPSSTPGQGLTGDEDGSWKEWDSSDHTHSLGGEARMWATLCHLSGLFFSFVGPLVLWLVFRHRYRRVDQAGREALNFQITLWLATAALAITLIGIPIAILVHFLGMTLMVIAAYRTSNGTTWRYPLTLRIL